MRSLRRDGVAPLPPQETRISLLDLPTQTATETKPNSGTEEYAKCGACKQRYSDASQCWLFCEVCLYAIEFENTPADELIKLDLPGVPTAQTNLEWRMERHIKRQIKFLRGYFAEEKKSLGPDRFKCFICKELLVEPRECFPCRHSFCEPCLRQQTNERKSAGLFHNFCPACCRNIHYSLPRKDIVEEILNTDEATRKGYGERRKWFAAAKEIHRMPLPGLAFLSRFHNCYMRLRKPSINQLTEQMYSGRIFGGQELFLFELLIYFVYLIQGPFIFIYAATSYHTLTAQANCTLNNATLGSSTELFAFANVNNCSSDLDVDRFPATESDNLCGLTVLLILFLLTVATIYSAEYAVLFLEDLHVGGYVLLSLGCGFTLVQVINEFSYCMALTCFPKSITHEAIAAWTVAVVIAIFLLLRRRVKIRAVKMIYDRRYSNSDKIKT